MLQPKKRKYRKEFRGKNTGVALRGSTLAFGDYGLKTLTGGWLTSQEIEAARKKITYATKRTGKYWIRIFPHKPVTKKPVGVKMGSGKGEIDYYVAVVKPGTILFEIGGVPLEIAQDAFAKAANKLSLRTKIVER